MWVYGFSQASTLGKCLLLITVIDLVSGNQWYNGCAWSNITTDLSYVVQGNIAATPATCCSHCYLNGFVYAVIGNSTCWCGDSTENSFEAPDKVCNEICEENSPLLCGSADAVSIYSSQGPYLLHLALSKASATVQTGVTSLFDARIELAGAADTETGIADVLVTDLKAVNFTWSINGSVVKDSVKLVTNTSSTSSLIYTFQQVGVWFIGVTASNAVSQRTATTVLHVVQPVPSDLQVVLRPGQGNIPSCVPEHDNLMSNLPAVAVFVDEQAEFQAYLSIGINLTFDWWFGDDGSHVTSVPYLEDGESCDVLLCLHSHQTHVFKEEGLFTVTVNASNELGSAQKTLHVIVMNRGISNLSLALLEGSHFTTPNTSLIFQLKMETADREQAFLSLDFDDGIVYNQSLRDVNETFISGGSANPANMYLTASYGDGCQLIVSFSHKYAASGSYNPKTLIQSNGTTYLAELSDGIFVQKSIEYVELESASSFPLGSQGTIFAVVPFDTNNMTYEWKVTLGNETVCSDITQNRTFVQAFDFEGQFIVQVTVKNLVSQSSALKVIRVQKAITSVSITVPDGGFVVALDEVVTFEAFTESVADLTFRWDFQNGSTYDDFGLEDASGSFIFSAVNHTFTDIGDYNISVTAWNLVSKVIQGLGQLMVVQEEISGLSAQSVHPTLLNQTSQVAVTMMRGSHVKFSTSDNGKEVLFPSELREDGTYMITMEFAEIGLHNINITASNNVSEVSTKVTHLVLEPISNFSFHLYPLSLGKVALVIYFDGELNSRDDVLYQWMMNGTTVTTSSGLFILEHNEIPENSTLMASNLVDVSALSVNVSEDALNSPFLVTHPSYVEVNATTSFTLSLFSGQPIRGAEITYRYNSSILETVKVPIASPILEWSWSHTFIIPGVWLLDIAVVDVDNGTMWSTSVVSVQEIVKEVSMVGPVLSRFAWPLTTLTWELKPSAGSSIMYDWEILPLISNSSSGSDNFKMTTAGINTLAYIPFNMPGTYNLTLTASNEISHTMIHTLTILREPITHLALSCSPVLHGLNSTIFLQVQGGPDFSFIVDFGDGTRTEATSYSPEVSLQSVNQSTHPTTSVFALVKHYADLGEYAALATVSNGVSDMEGSTVVRVEERITGLTIVTSNSWLVNAVDNITVEATVATGNDIIFTWDFNDMTGPTTVIHSNGSYSAVIHTFGMPGEYYISVSASNALQQDPLIYHYPSRFVVQQVPVALELNVYEGNNWASLEQTDSGWVTSTIIFRALCWGSHINFSFDYGDGYEEVVEGQLGLSGNYNGFGTHVYTAEGEFHVSVTAYNLLTNVTQSLGSPFIVVISPMGLSFDQEAYTFPFGNMSILTVTVDNGNNLFFNWSMGDQTNYLFAGPSVTHVYRTAARYTVAVVAFNKVQSLQATCTVDIVNFVSFVDLKVESQLATTYTYILFTAETPANSARYFKWDMGNGLPIRETSVNTLTYRYESPGIYYVSVEAGNYMSNATSNPVEMTLQARIDKMIIRTSAPALFGQRTVLEAQVSSRSNIQYVWSFGDGSPDLVTDQSVVLHLYNRTGEYFIRVFASNDVSNSSATTNIFILDEPCLAPELSIVSDLSTTINFSNPVKVEIEVFIDCDITQETVYQWSLVDVADGSPLELNPSIASLDKRTLFIPSHVVPIGSYTVTIEVRMNNTIVYARNTMSLTIRESPLIAVIEGGTTRTIDQYTLAYINGGFSLDPDHPSDSNLHYNWTCHLLDIPTEPCFDPSFFPNGSAPVPSINGSLVFPASWLRLDVAFQFVFYLTVSKEGRQPDVANQVLKVVSNEKMYELLVDCPSCDEGIVNSNAELTLEALCPTCGDNVTFVWELFVVWDGSTTYTSSASRCIHADESSPADSGTTVSPLTHVNTVTNQASLTSTTPVQQTSSPGSVHSPIPSQSPTSNSASPTGSTGSSNGQGTSPSAESSSLKSSTPRTSPSSSPLSHSMTSSPSGPEGSSSSSVAESLPQSSFQENFSSNSFGEFLSSEDGFFESVFGESFAAVETKQDNNSDDLTVGRSLDADKDSTSANKSASAAAASRSGFFESISSSSTAEIISSSSNTGIEEGMSSSSNTGIAEGISSSSNTGIAEGISSSSDAFAEAIADSSVSESSEFAEELSSVAEVASSVIQEEHPTDDTPTTLPASTALLSGLPGASSSSSSAGATSPFHTTTSQPAGGMDEDSILEYMDDSSVIFEESILEESMSSSTPTTKTTSGTPTTRSSTTTPGSIVEHGGFEDYSSVQEGDDSLYFDSSDGETSSLQSSANDGDEVANPDNSVTYEEHIVSRSSQALVITEDQTMSGLKSQQFTLKPGVLEEGRTYAVGVKIYPEDGSPGVRAEAYQYITVNEAPKLGICSITPDSGTELDTVFSAACHSWNDEDTPLQYEVRYSLNQSDPETILYYGIDRSVRFLLPAGHAENNHNVYLKLAIVDNKGGKTSVCDIAIPVSPKPFENLEDKLEYLDAVSVGADSMLAVYVAHGDDLNIHSHVRLVSHLLNHLSHYLEEEHDDEDHCHIITERCEIRSALLEGILALPVRDEYEILQVVGAINEVTSVPAELNAPCQRKVSGLLTTLATSSARCRWEESSLARDALAVMAMVASNVLESFHHNHTDDILSPEDSRDITEKMVAAMMDMLQVYLGHMTTESEAVVLASPLLNVQGSRLGILAGASFSVGGATFTLPPGLDALVGKPHVGESWTDRYRWNYPCYDAHMVTYVDNPFMWGLGANKVTTPVASLELYSCDDDNPNLVNVSNLPAGEEIIIDIDNISEELLQAYNYTFDPAYMSVHSFNVSRASIQQSFHISIKLTPVQRPIPITVLLRYGVEPTPATYDLCWNHNDDINSIDIFLPPDSFNVSGRYYLALVDGEFGETVFRQEGDQTRQYLLKMWWGECLYWDAAQVSWSPEGCATSSSSTFATTQCLCTHLSSFGVSFVPILTIVSFVDMQLFIGPNENPVTYMFVAGLMGVYALLFVYCYYADRHDEKKQGLIYLKDNQPGDKQYYDITVETGFRTGAGTTARVSIVLHGEEGHSETKELICDDKPIFERNSRDRFIISVPESLGNIQRLQLWHNNAGLSPSWYLSRVSVRDLLTGQKWFFICERWFAVEEDDGKIERELLVVGDGVGFTKAFFAKGAQYFADYYLWSSVFTRPPYSIFTRVQRLTCCLCISMGFMCVNTLWYQKLDKEESELGVIDVSGEAVLVGIVTALVAIPINFPLIMLFRRSKPWRMPGEIGELFKHFKSNSKKQSDPEEQTAAQLYNLQRWAREKWKHRHKSSIFKHLSENESSRSSIDAHSYSSGFGELSSEDRFRALFTDSDMTSPELIESWESLDTEPIPSMNHKKLKSPKIWLPHIFYFIAWGGSIFIVVASSLITIILGLKFTYAQAIYWMQSLYFSFLQCIFITQPCVMAMLTVGKAWKHSNNIKIFDHYDDNTDLIDKRMLHRSRVQLYEQDLSKAIAARQRSRYLRFARPPQPKELQKAKEKMLKEKHMYAILKDVILFLILIFCLLWMAYGKETSLHGPLNNSVNQIFLKTTHPFTNVTTVDELWNWLQEDMIDTLYWQRWYNGDPIAGDVGSVMVTGESILLGRPSLRQLRVRPHTCTVPPVMRPIIGDCQGGYSPSTHSRDPYGPEDKWVFRTAHQLLRYCKWGMFTTYEGDGYAVDFNNTRDDAESLLWHLRNNSWIDSKTRAVILEFTLYNAPYNLFSAVAFVAEIPGSGAVYPLSKVESVQLYRYEKPYDYFIMACELLFVLLVALISKQEVVKVVKQKRAYFRSAWSWVEMSLILVSITYFAMYVYRFAYVSEAGSRLKATYLEEFVDLSFLAWWDQRLRDLIGLILFIVTLKFLHLLRFNRMFAMFGAIFEAALGHLLLHMLCYIILETAFACLGNLLFGSHYYPFRNVYPAYEVISSLIVGSAPDHTKLWLLFPVLWPMFYISYIICMVIFMAGLIKAILCHNYRKVKHCPLETVSGQEVISFFWHRFLCWLGIREETVDDSDRDKLPMEFTMAEIQYQVDELVFRMNAILHQNGLPDKPFDYLDDSDATQNYHDDGISSYPSEDQEFDNDKFEERVQRLEEQLYFNNPELRELMTSPEDDDPDRHKGLRARLELEIFRQLQLSRQQDQLENDDPDLSGPDRDSGQMSASGSMASYDIGEESALSCADLNDINAGRPATAYRKDDGRVAFPQPMRNLGTLDERGGIGIPRKSSTLQAWADDSSTRQIGEPSKGEQPAETSQSKRPSKKNILKRLPRPHTAAVFPVRDRARLSDGEENQRHGKPGSIQHKDSNTSTASSSSAYSRRQSSDGMGSYVGSDSSHADTNSNGSRHSKVVDISHRRGRNWKVTPFTKHGWEGEDLGESHSSERSSCSSNVDNEKHNVTPPAPSGTNSQDSKASHHIRSDKFYSGMTTDVEKRKNRSRGGRPSADELVMDSSADHHQQDNQPLCHHPNLTVSMESFPLPNSLEHLVVSDSSDNEKHGKDHTSSRSHKRRKGQEGIQPRASKLRKTKSRGKGKGRSRLQDMGHVNDGYSSDSHGEEDNIPVIEMSKHPMPGYY